MQLLSPHTHARTASHSSEITDCNDERTEKTASKMVGKQWWQHKIIPTNMQLTDDWPGKNISATTTKKAETRKMHMHFVPIAHYYDSIVLPRRSGFFRFCFFLRFGCCCCCQMQYHRHRLFRCCLVIFIRSFSTKPIKEMCLQYKKR